MQRVGRVAGVVLAIWETDGWGDGGRSGSDVLPVLLAAGSWPPLDDGTQIGSDDSSCGGTGSGYGSPPVLGAGGGGVGDGVGAGAGAGRSGRLAQTVGAGADVTVDVTARGEDVAAGACVGEAVGAAVGEAVGACVGAAVGATVGEAVGAGGGCVAFAASARRAVAPVVVADTATRSLGRRLTCRAAVVRVVEILGNEDVEPARDWTCKGRMAGARAALEGRLNVARVGPSVDGICIWGIRHVVLGTSHT